MKILLAGEWAYDIYEPSVSAAMAEHGAQVIPFRWAQYFAGFLGKFERHFKLQLYNIRQLNEDLIASVRKHNPDVVFVWRGVVVLPKTLETIRDVGCVLVSYNNDDPFSSQYRKGLTFGKGRLWDYFLEGLRSYDINFVYRKKNVRDYLASGAKEPHLFLPYFVPRLHYYRGWKKTGDYDIVFVGHYEPDGRAESLILLARRGIRVRIFGTGWGACREREISQFGKIQPAVGPDYCSVIGAAKLALSFYSRLNNDTYTRRVFEIPAIGSALCTPSNPDVCEFYCENEEAIFFSDNNDLGEKVQWFLSRPEKLEATARAGHARCLSSGYDVNSRVKRLLDVISAQIR